MDNNIVALTPFPLFGLQFLPRLTKILSTQVSMFRVLKSQGPNKCCDQFISSSREHGRGFSCRLINNEISFSMRWARRVDSLQNWQYRYKWDLELQWFKKVKETRSCSSEYITWNFGWAALCLILMGIVRRNATRLCQDYNKQNRVTTERKTWAIKGFGWKFSTLRIIDISIM